MATSVPKVYPLRDLHERVTRVMEGAYEAFRVTGDPKVLIEPTKLVRKFYEEEMKPAAAKGRYDWKHLAKIGNALDAMEGIIARHTKIPT